VEVRATDKAVSVKAYLGDNLLFTAALAPNRSLVITPADPRVGRRTDKETLKTGLLKPKDWNVLRWRLADNSMEVTLNNVQIAKEPLFLVFLGNGTVRVKASEVPADVRGFAVRSLKK